jgi:hypothetical protein
MLDNNSKSQEGEGVNIRKEEETKHIPRVLDE